MNKFLIKISLFIIIVALIVNFSMFYYMFNEKDNWSIHSHEKNYVLSYNRLKALQDTDKIVIISGSNGGFSLNSEMISEAFHMPVVNTSTHAGIGVRMQFETYKDLLKKGDVIVFIPEYDDNNSRLYGNSTLLRIIGTHMPSSYEKISAKQWLHLYKYIGIHCKECYSHRKTDNFENSPYSEKALNRFGDIDFKREHQDSIKLYNLCGKMDSELIEYYKYVHTYLYSIGAKCIFLPPTLIESCYNKNKEQIDSVVISLSYSGIPYYASPIRYVFPDSLYFDTPYHMTPSGAKLRTKKVIEDMHKFLNRSHSQKE